MTTEEKAKAYDEAIEKLRSLHDDYDTVSTLIDIKEELEHIFPELKEGGDEKIRESLIGYLKECRNNTRSEVMLDEYAKWIAWLEKQGEQPKKVSIWKHWKDGICGNGEGKLTYLIKNGDNYNLSSSLGFECDYIELSELDRLMFEKQGEEKSTTDKVEPKFHEGEWCIDNEDGIIFQIVKVLDNTYTYRTNEGKEYSCTHYSLENDARLWTIKDAKDGDVLACNEEILLFKSCSIQGRISLYCWYNGQINNFHGKEVFDILLSKKNKIYPSTKEQRELLFHKMKEAGYEWDGEKKELKKIEQKPTIKDELFDRRYTQHLMESQRQKYMIQWKGDNLKEVIDFTGKDRNFYKWFKSFEEYEQYVQEHDGIFKLFNADGSHYEVPVGAWIVKAPDGYNMASKAIFKQRSTWSEEDENAIKVLMSIIKKSEIIDPLIYTDLLKEKLYDWLKSLKDRYTWKPSDVQMEILQYLCETSSHTNEKVIPTLESLYQDLKKLKENKL